MIGRLEVNSIGSRITDPDQFLSDYPDVTTLLLRSGLCDQKIWDTKHTTNHKEYKIFSLLTKGLFTDSQYFSSSTELI
jgi:hypothetical protein